MLHNGHTPFLCYSGSLPGYIIDSSPYTFYWATISLTTVGYGDVYATSEVGKLITMISAVLGIAIVALPAGIIIAGYQDELEEAKGNNV